MNAVRRYGTAFERSLRAGHALRKSKSSRAKLSTPAPASRFLFTEAITSIPGPLIPPLAFTGFFLSLWMYKCFMLVVIQNKIIYMPGLPPGARSETIRDYEAQCGSVRWEEQHMKSLDGTDLALAIGRSESKQTSTRHETVSNADHPVILYFQGNGASIPPRLPQLSKTLEAIKAASLQEAINPTIIALSYRGYWKSRGKPSQAGIEQDALAALRYARRVHPESRIILWGQSIGAGVATTLLAAHLRQTAAEQRGHGVAGLVLETPFLSLKDMLTALYPQKWLPYRHLYPFLRSHWDSASALQQVSVMEVGRSIPVLLVVAGADELVPVEHGRQLAQLCEQYGINVRTKVIPSALHVEAMNKADGRRAVADFITTIAKNGVVKP